MLDCTVCISKQEDGIHGLLVNLQQENVQQWCHPFDESCYCVAELVRRDRDFVENRIF